MIPSIEWAQEYNNDARLQRQLNYDSLTNEEKNSFAYTKATNELKFLYLFIIKKIGIYNLYPKKLFPLPQGHKNYKKMLSAITGNRIDFSDYVSKYKGFDNIEGVEMSQHLAKIYSVANHEHAVFTMMCPKIAFYSRSFRIIENFRLQSGVDSYLEAYFEGVPFSDIVA